MTANNWSEYDSAAKWCAQRGLRGEIGDPLPMNMSDVVCREIDADPEAFAERVRLSAYALAMDKLNLPPDENADAADRVATALPDELDTLARWHNDARRVMETRRDRARVTATETDMRK